MTSPETLLHCLSVVMPVFNEEKSVGTIVEKVLARPEVGELLVIDDASTDATLRCLDAFRSDPRVKVFPQPCNRGKGAALIRGFGEASMPFVIVQDADLEYDPGDYPELLTALVEGEADAVYGSRLLGNPGLRFPNRFANVVLTKVFNLFSGLRVSDMESCYKMFRRNVIRRLILTSNRFGIEVEIGAKLAKMKPLRLLEVPISYHPRRRDEGKKISWRDGVAALWHIVHFTLLTSRRKSLRESGD
ncbi:MAG: glycosyltransferase family 2 protein [Victivallaceae bacterium]|nr:glycosyltransferase family 2 protein [Victivallaceae bacterium]